MQIITNSQASIHKGENTSIGSIPKKAYDVHGIISKNKPLESIKFYDKSGNSMVFSNNEIYYEGTAPTSSQILKIRYSGFEYTISDEKTRKRFRDMFQYDKSKKNEILVQIIS